MRLALLAFALLPSAAFATISINTPSASQYWVQNTSNLIAWTYTQGDPTAVDIIVTNSNPQTLNGAFSIARGVPVSSESFTVTDVTLVVGTGYQVSFVSPTDASQVLAQSSNFEVKVPGTSPAPTSSPTTAASSETGTGVSSGSSTASKTATTSSTKNAAPGLAADACSLFYACGIVAFASFFL